MRHLAFFMSIVIIVFAAPMSISTLSKVAAQDATPEGMIGAQGVSFVPLAFAAVETLPPAPAGIVLSRYQIEPGAAQRTDAADPSLALVYQESLRGGGKEDLTRFGRGTGRRNGASSGRLGV